MNIKDIFLTAFTSSMMVIPVMANVKPEPSMTIGSLNYLQVSNGRL